jgi:amino acid transporter
MSHSQGFRSRIRGIREVPERRLSLLEAISVNMSLMVGIGLFITLPDLVGMKGLQGPQSMIAWGLGIAVALADGMVWSELVAAFPGSGGTYHFYDAAYGGSRIGRILKFLFVWQFFFSGPLEIASGAIGLTKYLGYFFPSLGVTAWNWGSILPGTSAPVVWGQVAAMGVMLAVTALAYRRISVAGRLMVVLWIGMMLTVLWVIVAAASRFDARLAFDFPPGAFQFDFRTTLGLGMALAIVMYNFLGYYQVCYLADEVADAPRAIPRSILFSVLVVGLMYMTMSVTILGVVPWRDVMESKHIASDLILMVNGPWAARLITIMIVWTAIASLFSAILGYSRIPYASARAGHFFRAFATLHPTGHFPHRGLLLIGGVAAIACLAELKTVIDALIASRIPIQFVGQIATVFYLRSRAKEQPATFRMPLYPLPALIALFGWCFIFVTSEPMVILYSVLSMIAGIIAFYFWDAASRGFESRSVRLTSEQTGP